MDSTLGSSSCNDSTLSLLDSTPRSTLFSSISDSFNLPSSESPTEPILKTSTSTPSFANDSYSDIAKVRSSKTYTYSDHSSQPNPSPSPNKCESSPQSLMKAPNRLASTLPRKESPLVTHSVSTGQRPVPTTLSLPKNLSSSSSVSSINSDDDTFFEQLATLQNTLENAVSARASPGHKIADFDSLLTGEILSQKCSPPPSSESNSPLKDPTHQFCLSRSQLRVCSPSHPLSACAALNRAELPPTERTADTREEDLKAGEQTGGREKENSPAGRGVPSAIKPAQILHHWGGTGRTSSRPAQKRVTFDNKVREVARKTASDHRSENPTPTRPHTRWRKVHSAPSLPSPDPESPTECLSMNSRVWCPTACAANLTALISPNKAHPKRICRGGSTPEFPSSPGPARLVLRSNSSPANPALNSSLSPGEELIGDNSGSHLLPVIHGSNPDLKSIEPLTLVRVLAGEFAQHIANLVIVDCRYPYEFKGGHIKTALNIWTEELSFNFFLKSTYVPTSDLRHVVVFYCEFSTMRGPNQYRYLRNEDRKLNEATFPKLHYPELYVLEGGYARFFSVACDSCDPSCYIPMLHEDYKEELAKCHLLKHQGSKRAVSGSCRVARPSKSKCRRKQKFN